MSVPSTAQQSVVPLEQITANAVASAIVEQFLAPLSDASRKNIRYSMSRIASAAGMHPTHGEPVEALPWHTLTSSTLTYLVETWRRAEYANATIALNVQIVRGIASALFIRGLISGDQLQLMKMVKAPKGKNKAGRGRSVATRWRDLMLEDCMNDERPQGVRDAALLAVFFGVGLRRGEVSKIQVEKVDLDAGEIRLKVKGGNEVIKYLSPLATRYLLPWIQLRAHTLGYQGNLFCRIVKGGKLVDKPILPNGLYYLLEERSKRAGLPFLVRPHDARRTLGTWALSSQGELVAKEILGHANLSTTAIYDMRGSEIAKQALKGVN